MTKALVYSLIFSLITTFSFSQNHCLDFDGTSDYISMNTFLLPIASANDTWTVEMMVKTTSTGDDTLFSQYITSSNNRSHININGTVSYWKFTAATVVTSTTIVNDGLWHHIAIVKEGSGTDQVHLYVDGILEDSGTDSSVMANTISEMFVSGQTSEHCQGINIEKQKKYRATAYALQRLNDLKI